MKYLRWAGVENAINIGRILIENGAIESGADVCGGVNCDVGAEPARAGIRSVWPIYGSGTSDSARSSLEDDTHRHHWNFKSRPRDFYARKGA